MTQTSSASLSCAPVSLTTAKPARLASLDIFRGMTIAGMLLVNNMGDPKYDPLEHAHWNGWTPTDLVFPFFCFIMGVAIPFSFAKRAANESKGYLFRHVMARGLSLFLLGEFGYSLPYWPYPAPTGLHLARYLFAYAFLLAGFVALLYPWRSKRAAVVVPWIAAGAFAAVLIGLQLFNRHLIASGVVPGDFSFGMGMLTPDHLRIPGVLQRLGVCYAAAASLALVFCGPSQNSAPNTQHSSSGWKPIAAIVFVILAGYAATMLTVSYPSLSKPGTMIHGSLERNDNLARYVDETVLGSQAHPVSWGVHTYSSYPDPEGILSTIPAIGTALLGVLAGLWLRSSRSSAQRCAGLMAFGVIACILASFLDSMLMPINKNLWSSSYVVMCAGLSLLGLGAYFYLVDVLNFRKIFLPFTWYGMNAITAFVLAGIVPRITNAIRWTAPESSKSPYITLHYFWSSHVSEWGRMITFGDPAKNGSLAYAASFVLVFWVIVAILYRLKIFLKV